MLSVFFAFISISFLYFLKYASLSTALLNYYNLDGKRWIDFAWSFSFVVRLMNADLVIYLWFLLLFKAHSLWLYLKKKMLLISQKWKMMNIKETKLIELNSKSNRTKNLFNNQSKAAKKKIVKEVENNNNETTKNEWVYSKNEKNKTAATQNFNWISFAFIV